MIIQEIRIAIKTNQETALNHHIEIAYNTQTIEMSKFTFKLIQGFYNIEI